MDQTFENGRFLLGDCLERMRELPDASVDMILCDLPYGTTQNKWDAVIPFEPLWREYWRIAKPGAAVVLTAAQPFTSALVMSQASRFKYCVTWDKVNAIRGHLNAKHQPMRQTEDIAVFYASRPTYNPQMREGQYVSRKTKPGLSSNYGNVTRADAGRKISGLYPTDLIRIPGHDPNNVWHPTQKPIALFEYLIRTYTDEGMVVLDNCAGSGTTAIAAERTGRKWVCIERDETYFTKACGRVAREVFGDLA